MRPLQASRFADTATLGNLYTLHPGDVACATRGDRLETLLGSCVAIVLTDPRRTMGAMCHIVHCRPAPAEAPASAAYADVALHSMYEMLRAHGINPLMCEAYIFGGGNMFPELFPTSHVGTCNARWALEALAADGVRVLSHDLGGNTYRRLAWTVGPDAPEVTAVAV
ncbi:MAG: chemotaxis protein CheD [Burkholderiales bacterium]|nr:chemotaxis protein CheD [Burkholderiales bacterium]MDE2396330.1 chemotaxis protein CheD [Burkholderiales bacterium]MDE2453522.1 chemotaxis protein CheD [Burkholderiales bacterium]